MANIDADIRIKSLSFVDSGDIPREIGEGSFHHANIRLTEPPYGVFLMTFDDRTGEEIAHHMTGEPVTDGQLNQLQESALQEMCNILTSGFIDGIANTLETTINMETPSLEYDDATVIAEETLSIVLDSVVDLKEENKEFELRIFLVPDPGAFVNLIDKLDVEEIRKIDDLSARKDDDRAF